MNRGVLLVALVACGGSRGAAPEVRTSTVGGDESGDIAVAGGHLHRGDVERALDSERRALQALDQRITDVESRADNDAAATAGLRADATARAAYADQLQRCLSDATQCPPSLDEPTIDADFDAASGQFKGAFASSVSQWPDAAATLEKHACGCRTAACVDWVMADLDRWEASIPADAQADEVAATHVVGARACLWTRLGHRAIGASSAASSAE